MTTVVIEWAIMPAFTGALPQGAGEYLGQNLAALIKSSLLEGCFCVYFLVNFVPSLLSST